LKRKALRWFRLTAGSALLLLGFVGGFIPVLQGWVFVLAGLGLMAPESRRARRALDWVRARVKRDKADVSSAAASREKTTDE
jgi:uncharacterized membrane protein YbaN (DUF454 family)